MIKGGGAGGLLDLEIDGDGIERLVLDLVATPAQVEKAFATALRRTALWLRAKSVKGLSNELKVQQKIIRRRLRSFRLARHGTGQTIGVWYGLDPIAYIYLGTPRKTADGVRVGGHDIPGGFVAKGKNGQAQVFKREGTGRLPLVKQTMPIADQAETYIEDRLLGTASFDAAFFNFFEHELKWRTSTHK